MFDSISAQRRIGRFAWAMAWFGLVAGQFHAMARHQTADGKAVLGVAGRAQTAGVPVAVLAGTLAPGHETLYGRGVDCAMSIVPAPMALQDAMARAEPLIEAAAARLARLLSTGRKIDDIQDGVRRERE